MDRKNISVVKRDGTTEDFEQEKIAKVAQAAGLMPMDAEELSEVVADWVEERQRPDVPSISIRDKVFKELDKRDKYAAGLFAWYQSTKEKNGK